MRAPFRWQAVENVEVAVHAVNRPPLLAELQYTQSLPVTSFDDNVQNRFHGMDMGVGDEQALLIDYEFGGARVQIRFANLLQGRAGHQTLVHTA